MLPNFRRAENETAKPVGQLVANDAGAVAAPAFPARSYLPSPRVDAGKSVSVIGADLTIQGNLVSKGEVQIDGQIEGDITGNHVAVGEGARVSGNIMADEVVVRGHVVGTIRSKRVMLQATSQVDGDIYHQSLSIEQGAMFEGKSRRTNEDPRTSGSVSASNVSPLLGNAVTTLTPPRLPEAPAGSQG